VSASATPRAWSEFADSGTSIRAWRSLFGRRSGFTPQRRAWRRDRLPAEAALCRGKARGFLGQPTVYRKDAGWRE
jgi:hypothetical protein